MKKNVSSHYLRNKIESASPIGRILIMFEACNKFLNKSREGLVNGDKMKFVENNIRAQNILRELRNSLNLDLDEKIAVGFYRLYNFMIKRLMQAVRSKNVEHIDVVKRMVAQLYQSWKTAQDKGLGKDIKNVEERKGKKEGSLVRTSITPTQRSHTKLNEGLNLIS